MTDKIITLKWHCGYLVGPLEWRWIPQKQKCVFTQAQCDTRFETHHHATDYEASTCWARCPVCNAKLRQSEGHTYTEQEKG